MSDDTEFAYFAGRREGAAAERNRIIRLLESWLEQDMRFHKFSTLVNIEVVIEFIREQSEVDSNPTETETECNCKKQP